MPTTAGTKQELLAYLDKMTREVDAATSCQLTTARIAADNNVSRSLASQYLNELVRDGLVIKINSRPVVYLHKSVFAHHLQATLEKSEYASMAELLRAAGIREKRDFERAIGYDLSLAPVVEQLKAAITYPPNGLPILLSGEPGSGRARLASLAFEFGRNSGALSSTARYARLDCLRYASDAGLLRRVLLGAGDHPGTLDAVSGGVVYLENFEVLDQRQQRAVLSLLDEYGRTGTHREGGSPARIIVAQGPSGVMRISRVAGSVPILVSVPPLRERTVEERTELVMHFLRLEGGRVLSEFSISRGALRALVEASFPDNVDGLRACVVGCCSDAYATRDGETLAIRAFNLPSSVLDTSSMCDGDDRLVSCRRNEGSHEEASREERLIEKVLGSYQAFEEGATSFGEFLSEATASVRDYQDYLNFGQQLPSSRTLAYEQVLNAVFESVGAAHNVDLTRKSARLLAQCLESQLASGHGAARRRRASEEAVARAAATLAQHLSATSAVVDQLVAETKTALGLESDALVRLVLMLDVNPAVSDARLRTCVGIVCCHGYSTATSIADAANRILHAHVFDAVDMTYDQQVTDVIRPLRRLLERYRYCRQVVLLVDMGSLTELASTLSETVDADVVVVNNVSTGLALELGSAIRSGEPLEERLEGLLAPCAPGFRIVRNVREADVVVFCSESGMDAADKIRRLFAESLPADGRTELVVVDYQELVKHGVSCPVFARGRVRAIVGTMDPGVDGVPFFALEDILYEGPTERLDRVFFRSEHDREVATFHASLLKRLTLQNVIESITILNPERLYAEVSRAVERLEKLSGEGIAPAATIGLYVHLCCLVERLVTKTPIEVHANREDFEREHASFIDAFRTSFADISDHYRVEVPVTEIAYVFDYINSKSVTRERPSSNLRGGALPDE